MIFINSSSIEFEGNILPCCLVKPIGEVEPVGEGGKSVKLSKLNLNDVFIALAIMQVGEFGREERAIKTGERGGVLTTALRDEGGDLEVKLSKDEAEEPVVAELASFRTKLMGRLIKLEIKSIINFNYNHRE